MKITFIGTVIKCVTVSIWCKLDTFIASGVLKSLTMFVSSVSKRCRKNYTHEKNLKMMNCWRLQLPSTWNLYLCDASLAVDWHKKTPWHTVFTWCSHLFTCLVSPGTRLVLYLTSRWRSPWCAWQWWGISPSYKGCHLTLTRVDLLLLTLIVSLCHICVVSP